MNDQQYLTNYIEKMNQALESEQLRRQQVENQYTKDSAFPNIDAKNIIEYQLDSNRLLDKAFHLLSGHVIIKNEKNEEVWADPKDDRLKIFSKYGVERIMNLLSFYITPEIVTSIFDEETIKREVLDFGTELSDLIANRYELFFYYPSPEELFERLLPIAKEEEIDISEQELYYKCVEWSNDELRLRLANYPIIVTSLIALVHGNYRRALKGETLKSLRTIIHVSQNMGVQQSQPMDNQNKFKLLRPSTWGKSS